MIGKNEKGSTRTKDQLQSTQPDVISSEEIGILGFIIIYRVHILVLRLRWGRVNEMLKSHYVFFLL